MIDRPTGGDSEPFDREELRRVEARLSARIQEVHARLVLHDGRFAAIADRLNQSHRRSEAFTARTDERIQAVDGRFDSLDTRLDDADRRDAEVREQLIEAMRKQRAALWRTTILGLSATALVSALMTGATIMLVT